MLQGGRLVKANIDPILIPGKSKEGGKMTTMGIYRVKVGSAVDRLSHSWDWTITNWQKLNQDKSGDTGTFKHANKENEIIIENLWPFCYSGSQPGSLSKFQPAPES